jgi:FdhE protein
LLPIGFQGYNLIFAMTFSAAAMKTVSWDDRIARAQKLATDAPASKDVLGVYTRVAKFQRAISNGLNGSDHPDITCLLDFVPDLQKLVNALGSVPLQQKLQSMGRDTTRWSEMLLKYWEQQPEPESSSEAVIAYLLLQPYAQHVTGRMTVNSENTSPICPACANPAELSVLREYNNGAKRSLVCSLCSTEWEFRRVLCPNCGEQDKDKLPVFTAEQVNQARIEACDSCKTYIKCIDMTKDGYAVPQVDDLATLSLDFWAQEQGYQRQLPNMFLLPSS